MGICAPYYTIPSDNRELQRTSFTYAGKTNYTIPSDNRELQPAVLLIRLPLIIPYQVITGNYNKKRTVTVQQ